MLLLLLAVGAGAGAAFRDRNTITSIDTESMMSTALVRLTVDIRDEGWPSVWYRAIDVGEGILC